MQPMNVRFLTLQEAAARLQLGLRTAYRLAQEGSFPGAVKMGGQWRVAEWRLTDPFETAAAHGAGAAERRRK